MLSVVFGAMTGLMVVSAIIGHWKAYSGDRDRLMLSLSVTAVWVFEEFIGRRFGWESTWQIAPAFDFAVGSMMLLAWLRRPAHWRMFVWLIFWAMCVAHLGYRLEALPTDAETYRYRVLVNALYTGLFLVVTGSVVWDVLARRPRHSGPVVHRVPAGHHSGHGGPE